MPSIYYRRDFVAGSTYHLKNTGVLGSEIFREPQDYQTFIFILSYFLRLPDGKPLSYLQIVKKPYARKKAELTPIQAWPVELIAFTLLPTHFHLVLTEKLGGTKPGISNLMKHLSVTYAMYMNNKYGRTGSLFQGKYKMVNLPSTEHLLELTKYLHREPGDPQYPHSSYPDYLHNARTWVNSDPVLAAVRAKNTLSYRTFVEDTPANLTFLRNITLD